MEKKQTPSLNCLSPPRTMNKSPTLPEVDTSSSSSTMRTKNKKISSISKSTRVTNNQTIVAPQKHLIKPRAIESKGDPLLDRLAQRFPSTFDRQRHQRNQQEYHVEFLGLHENEAQGEQRRPMVSPSKAAVPLPLAMNEKVEGFVSSLKDEAASIITRHLPDAVHPPPGDTFFSSSPPYNTMLAPREGSDAESGTKTIPFVVDDRITPATVHALLQKGRNAASRVLREQAVRDMGKGFKTNKLIKSTKCDGIYKNISRLEPPYVGQIMQAQMHTKNATAAAASPTQQTTATTSSRGAERELQVDAIMERCETPSMVFNAAITRTTCAGDDAGLIGQVLDSVMESFKKESDVESIDTASVFSPLNAVLSVSKEFEKLRQCWSDNNAREASITRHAIVERLTSVESSLVPHNMWVMANRPTFSSSQLAEKDEESARLTSGLLFPAANPRGRAQVYLLAEVLERMTEEKPEALGVLSDRKLAERLLPPDLSNDTRTGADRLLDANAIQVSDDVHLQYVEAAEHMVKLIDVALVEIVRQTACMCAERGALLDLIRLVTIDLFDSCLHIVSHCKETARREAKARRDIVHASRKDVEGVILLREEVREAKREAEALRLANADLEVRAYKFDTLMERLKLKDQNFSRHPTEEHLQLLMELENGYTRSTSKGLEVLYKVTQTEGDEKVYDTPTTQLNQMNEEEKRTIQKDLYTESYKLLGALTDSLEAVDAACSPLYEGLALPKPAMLSNVAMSRWAQVARTVGMHEADKKHRRRVFEVFTEWNSEKNQSAAVGDQTPQPRPSHDTKPGSAPATPEPAQTQELPLPILVDNSVGQNQESSTTTMLSSQTTQPMSAQSSGALGKSPTEHPPPRRKLVTTEDLINMGATDCTPDEINALYDTNFDIAGYLRPSYETLPEHTVDLKEVNSMLHDVTEFLKHVTLRMSTLMNSGFLRESMKPPKKPPSRPEDPCALCGRRDRVAMEKKSKGEVMQRLANEIQRRYDEVVLKCQRTEAEREELRRRVQRLEVAGKKKLADWTRREEELVRSNQLLEEENRALTMQVSLDMAPVQADTSGDDSPDTLSSSSERTASFWSEG